MPDFTLLHLPKLHAKVYVGDFRCAIVTSANLTGGGLGRNYEYGIRISDHRSVKDIADDIRDYSDLARVSYLHTLCFRKCLDVNWLCACKPMP